VGDMKWNYKVYTKENNKIKVIKSGGLAACFTYLSNNRSSEKLYVGVFSERKLLKELV